MLALINIAAPSSKTRTGFDGEPYELVSSDEIEIENRTLYPGGDPYWEGHLVRRHERLEEREAEHFDGECG
jgi:hypothetical protein